MEGKVYESTANNIISWHNISEIEGKAQQQLFFFTKLLKENIENWTEHIEDEKDKREIANTVSFFYILTEQKITMIGCRLKKWFFFLFYFDKDTKNIKEHYQQSKIRCVESWKCRNRRFCQLNAFSY